jgi:hypothetical protein
MWAMMPMFRVRLSGVSLGIIEKLPATSYQLPALGFQLGCFSA